MTRNAKHIGYCIYCGATSVELSDEHIVPYSLGGDVTLPEASCATCAATTSKFERQVARKVLGPYRTRTGAPTRRPKERPEMLTLKLVDQDGSRREIELEPSSHPATLLLPDLPEPSILLPVLIGERRKFSMYLALPDKDVLGIATEHGATAMHLGSFEIGCFYQLLAKIAHAAAFLDPDWTSVWEPLLPDIIVGGCEDYDRFVGGSETGEFKGGESSFPLIFRSVDVEKTRYLVAVFRLYGQNQTPIYQVVVGRLRT